MAIRTCPKRGNKFSYKEIFYSTFPKHRGITCSACGIRYKFSEFSRLLIAALMTAPVFAAFHIPEADYNGSVAIYMAYTSIYVALLISVTPFLLSLKLETGEE